MFVEQTHANLDSGAGRSRSWAGLALAAATTLAVVGCGGPSSNGTSGSSSSGQTLNIGVIYPYTGANADQGAVGMAGCLAGIARVNAAGGAMGAKLAC